MISRVWDEQHWCSKAHRVSDHSPFISEYIFKYTHNLNPLRGKKTQTSENQRLPFPEPSLSVSSSALRIPLASQTSISTSPAAPPSSTSLHFSLPHLLAFPSILGSLPHIAQSFKKTTHVWEQISAQLVEDYFLILAFLHPDPIL